MDIILLRFRERRIRTRVKTYIWFRKQSYLCIHLICIWFSLQMNIQNSAQNFIG
nr:hypothetical protein Iba_chr04aCG3610 [Ipomoea batatas]GMC87872.1 hypothetical protein Iba_chr04eCG4640 [Ipomoea batatas]GMC89780.1 hypothetical protein Iba_chr04fCG2010 [Ipomoea batatas]